MLKLMPIAALLLFALVQPSAYGASCEGQKGKIIFEDDFSDDAGGWPADREASFGKSGLLLHIQEPSAGWVFLNGTFAATEGDFCLEAVLPKAAAADIGALTGLAFLANDASNFYVLQIGSDDAIQLYRREGGNWVKLGDLSEPKIKLEPGSVVALRAVLKANLITASVNGIEMKKLRAQLPGGHRKFGIYLQTDKAVPAPGVTFQFKKYKLMSGE